MPGRAADVQASRSRVEALEAELAALRISLAEQEAAVAREDAEKKAQIAADAAVAVEATLFYVPGDAPWNATCVHDAAALANAAACTYTQRSRQNRFAALSNGHYYYSRAGTADCRRCSSKFTRRLT